MRGALLTVCLSLLAAGCGYDRTVPADADAPQPPSGEREVEIDGLSFTAPGNWPDLAAQDTRIGGLRSGRATVAIWRYPRAEDLPADRAGLERARDLLVERVRTRDPGFEESRARIVRRGGAPGVELVGEQTIAGTAVRTRSCHLYADGNEYVIDAYAPPGDFEALDKRVFLPLLRSLELEGS